MSIFSVIGGLLGPLGKALDDVHTSEEERDQARLLLTQAENEIKAMVIGYEQKLVESQATIIVAEAQSSSWITASWRPLTMLTFVALIVLIATGIMDTEALAAVPEQLWSLLTIGIGGYIGGRTLEKTIPGVVEKMTSK